MIENIEEHWIVEKVWHSYQPLDVGCVIPLDDLSYDTLTSLGIPLEGRFFTNSVVLTNQPPEHIINLYMILYTIAYLEGGDYEQK